MTKMKLLLVALLLACSVQLATAADDKIRQAIEKGVVTGAFLNTLTPDDVPDKWKAQKSTKETDKAFTQIYTHDGVRLLEVMWAKDWKGDKERMFVASIYRGDKRLTKIMRLGDSTSIIPSDATKGYQVFTSIKDDGTVTVTVTDDDNSFFESVVVKGRDTHLLDDLEYTKAALAIEGITKPLMGVLQEAIDKKAKKKSKAK